MQNPAHASIPIFAVTAKAFAKDKERAEQAGMNGHIAMPIDKDQLLAILSDLFRK